MEKMVEPQWALLEDHLLAIRLWFDHDSSMSFRVFEAGDTHDGWLLFDGMDSYRLDQWGDAPFEIDGFLKWDGCINWQTDPDCMMHGCGPRHVDQITAIFTTVYAVGKLHMDLLGEQTAPLPANVRIIAEPIPA